MDIIGERLGIGNWISSFWILDYGFWITQCLSNHVPKGFLWTGAKQQYRGCWMLIVWNEIGDS
jgi:hypothetical protein